MKTATPKHEDWIVRLCRHIEANAQESLTLAELSRVAGVSAHHLQRRFTAAVGISPKQYQDACRLGTLRQQLRTGLRVSDAIQEAGFGSDSRVYEKSNAQLGMTPAQYAKGGAGLAISWATQKTSLGLLMLAATDRGICSVQLGDSRDALLAGLQQEFPRAAITPMPASAATQFARWMQTLQALLDGSRAEAGLPLDIGGTAFQRRVWQYLQKIPCGETRSYAQVAAAIGAPGSARAVGTACGSNRIALLIPCHRVLRGDGGDGGYRWGIERKRELLRRERGQ